MGNEGIGNLRGFDEERGVEEEEEEVLERVEEGGRG